MANAAFAAFCCSKRVSSVGSAIFAACGIRYWYHHGADRDYGGRDVRRVQHSLRIMDPWDSVVCATLAPWSPILPEVVGFGLNIARCDLSVVVFRKVWDFIFVHFCAVCSILFSNFACKYLSCIPMNYLCDLIVICCLLHSCIGHYCDTVRTAVQELSVTWLVAG